MICSPERATYVSPGAQPWVGEDAIVSQALQGRYRVWRIDADRCVAPLGLRAFIAFVTQACGLGACLGAFASARWACRCCVAEMFAAGL